MNLSHSHSQNLFHNLEHQLGLQQKIEGVFETIIDIFKKTPEDKYSVLIPEILYLFEKDNFEINKELVERGLRFALKHHLGQYRDSGVPYASHPVQVAYLINSWGFSTETILTAIFHDVIEENESKQVFLLNEIYDSFGAVVAGDTLILSTFEVDRSIRDKNHFNKILTQFKKTGDARLLYIKSSDGLSNGYTKRFMGPKNGLSAIERQRVYCEGILRNNLPIAKYLDKAQGIDLNLSMYLNKLAKS